MDWSTLFPAIAQAQAARMGGGFQPPGLALPPQLPSQAMAMPPQLPPQAMPAMPPPQPLPPMQPPKLPPQGMIGRGAAPGLPFAF
jgi:hypothetical protein